MIKVVRLSPTTQANGHPNAKYVVYSILRPEIALQRRTHPKQAFWVPSESEGKNESSLSTTQKHREGELRGASA